MTENPILSIKHERAAAQRRLRFKRYLRQHGITIPQEILRNEAALRELFTKATQYVTTLDATHSP